MKKGRKAESDMSDLVWRPTHSVGLVSLLGQYDNISKLYVLGLTMIRLGDEIFLCLLKSPNADTFAYPYPLLRTAILTSRLLFMIYVKQISLFSGMELGGTRMCFNAQQLEAGIFNIASFDGELIHAQYNKPDGDENADYIKSSVQVCVHDI